jgi:hypothetical protein
MAAQGVHKIGVETGIEAALARELALDPDHPRPWGKLARTLRELVAGHDESRDDHARLAKLEERVKALEQRPADPFPAS